MTTYQLSKLTSRQAQVINQSLEFYSRILMGQLEEVADLTPRLAKESFDEWLIRRDKVRYLMREAKEVYTGLFPPAANLGIHCEDISDNARIAYDIHQVIRQRLHRDENPNPEGLAKWSVWNDDPLRTSTTETTLPAITKIEPATHEGVL